jgi:hypothetical protein
MLCGWSNPIDLFPGIFDYHLYKLEAIDNNKKHLMN